MTKALVLAIVLGVGLLACGDNKDQGAVFESAQGVMRLSGGFNQETGLVLVDTLPHDLHPTTYFSPTGFARQKYLEVWLQATDGNVVIAINQNVEGPGRYTNFDPNNGGSIHVFIGKACEGGNGDIYGGACQWYGSFFYSEGCGLTIDSIGTTRLQGRVECQGLGANCYEGSGNRAANGSCLEGRPQPVVDLVASFELTEPRKDVPVPSAR